MALKSIISYVFRKIVGDMDVKCLPPVDAVPQTILLVGRTGNGKSSTGNSIIGKYVFKSELSLSVVTRTLDCQTAMFPDGRVLNVIDTPRLFDFHVGSESIKNEIMKCIELAKDGIHAVILVLSLRARFTEEEAATIQILSTLFGPSFTDNMIVLLTGDGCLKKGVSREDFLLKKIHPGIQEILGMCKNRAVFFDNDTDNEEKKTLQLTKLLRLVDEVVEDNGGKPYIDSRFMELKEVEVLQRQKEVTDASTVHSKQELSELTEKNQSSYDEQLKRMTEMVESNLRLTTRFEDQFADERAARRHSHSEIKQMLEDFKSGEMNRMKSELKDANRWADRTVAKCRRLEIQIASSSRRAY